MLPGEVVELLMKSDLPTQEIKDTFTETVAAGRCTMADFCWDCVKSLGVHPEKNDLRDLCDKGDVAQVLCEGCGFIYVDHLGKKVNAEDVPRQDFEKLVNDVLGIRTAPGCEKRGHLPQSRGRESRLYCLG